MPREDFFLGQIGNPGAALPGGAGAGLWWLSEDSYGQQATSTGGANRFLALETDDIPIADGGATILRRIRWRCIRSGSVTLRITPTINLKKRLAAKTIILVDAGEDQEEEVLIKVARRCERVRILVEVLACTGRFAFYPLFVLQHRPLGAAVPSANLGASA